MDPIVGALPVGERYLGTFVLEASTDASGAFEIGITPPVVPDTGASTILITSSGSIFPADVDDPAIIPITASSLPLSVMGPPPIPTVSEWGLAVLALLVMSAGTLVLRLTRRAAPA